MLRHEEQESQSLDVNSDPGSVPSSPSRGPRNVSHGAHDEHGMAEPETQQESMGSVVDDTQFDSLHLQTQVLGDSHPSFQAPAEESQHTVENAPASARSLSPVYGLPIARPKADEPASGGDFRFEKAQKNAPFNFGRPPMKAENTPRPHLPMGSRRQNSAPSVQSLAPDVSLPTLPRPKHPAGLPSTRVTAPTAATHSQNQVPSGHAGARHDTPLKPAKEDARESSRRSVTERTESTYSAVTTPNAKNINNSPPRLPVKDTFPYSDPSFPSEAELKASNKSSKRSVRKQIFQPFPEVDHPSRVRRLGLAISSLNKDHVASAPLRSVDANAPRQEKILKAPMGRRPRVSINQIQPDIHQANEKSVEVANPASALHLPTVTEQQTERENEETQNGLESFASMLINEQPSNGLRGASYTPYQRGQTPLQNAGGPSSHNYSEPVANKFDDELQPLFQPPVHHERRSQSAQSNTAKQIIRPVAALDLVPETNVQELSSQISHSFRVQKTTGNKASTDPQARSNGEIVNSRPTSPSWVQKFQRHNSEIEKHLEDYENQKRNVEMQQESLRSQASQLEEQRKELESQQSKLESRDSKIGKLERAIEQAKQQIQLRGEEITALTAKLKRFGEVSAKYKAHMNDVVVAQKHLMGESTRIKKESDEIREEKISLLKVLANRDGHERRLRELIDSSKTIPLTVEKVKKLEEENYNFKNEVENARRSNSMLQSELNARILDLGRERYNTEQLQKNLNAQQESHKDLIATLTKSQSAIVDELTKEGSALSNLVSSESSIQAKIDELSGFINTINNREPDVPPALIKLVEDLYTKIEEKVQAAANAHTSLSKSTLKLFEDLKEPINQLRLDEGTKTNLNEQIEELRQSNNTLTTEKSAKELERQNLMTRIDELGRELAGCRDQLTVKEDELTALRALPKDDPILLGKIQALEDARTLLQGQLNTANKEMSKVLEEFASYQKVVQSNQEQVQELESKLSEANASVAALGEEKKKFMANRKAEVEQACQKSARASQASKAETQLKHDSRVKNLEQRCTNAERDVMLAQEKLQKSEEKRLGDSQTLSELQRELLVADKRLTQQGIYLQHVDQRNPSRNEFDKCEGALSQLREEIVNTRAYWENGQADLSKKCTELLAQAEQSVRIVDLIKKQSFSDNEKTALEKEKAVLVEQHTQLRKESDALATNVSLYLRRYGIEIQGISLNNFFAAEAAKPPPRIQSHIVPKTFPERNSSINAKTTPSLSRLSNDLSDALSESPKEALRRNELKQSLSIQSVTKFQREAEVTPKISSTTKLATVSLPAFRALSQTSVASPSDSYHSGSPYQVQSTPKVLRPANRQRSSSSTQPVSSAPSSQASRRANTATSMIDNIPGVLSTTLQTPTHMALSSAGTPHKSTPLGSRFSQQSRPPASNAMLNRNASLSVSDSTPTTTPATPAAVLASSSPLSELNFSVDQLSYHESPVKKVVEWKAKKIEPPVTNKVLSTVASSQISRRTSAGIVKFKQATPPSHHFSDNDSLSGIGGARIAQPPGPTPAEEADRRRHAVPRKSALKKKGRASNVTNTLQDSIYDIDSATPDPLQKGSSTAAFKGKQGAQGRKVSVGSSYNRIVSGSKPEAFSEDSGPQAMTDKSAMEKSPVMQQPKRQRKRSASLTNTRAEPSKKIRVSLPHQSQKSGRTVMPDSQDQVQYRR